MERLRWREREVFRFCEVGVLGLEREGIFFFGLWGGRGGGDGGGGGGFGGFLMVVVGCWLSLGCARLGFVGNFYGADFIAERGQCALKLHTVASLIAF